MKTSLLAAVLLAGLSLSANAAQNYDYVQGGYVHARSDGFNANGFALKGSKAVTENVHLTAGYIHGKASDFDVRTNTFSIGAGYNRELTSSTDFVAGATYNRTTVKANNASGSGNAWGVHAGVITTFSERIGGHAFLNYAKPTKGDGDFSATLGLAGNLGNNWSVIGEVTLADGNQTYFIGPRYSF